MAGISRSVITTPISGDSAICFNASGALLAGITLYPKFSIASQYSSRQAGSSSTIRMVQPLDKLPMAMSLFALLTSIKFSHARI